MERHNLCLLATDTVVFSARIRGYLGRTCRVPIARIASAEHWVKEGSRVYLVVSAEHNTS